MKAVLKKHGANAITINCLGGFYGGHIHAYPCLGFHELGNEGLVGACECDVRSTATMVAFDGADAGAAGIHFRPGDRHVEAADHLRALRGVEPGVWAEGRANPFEILTHSEDRQGASVRSMLPVGYMTTTRGVRAGAEGDPVPSGEGGGERSGRSGVPDEAGGGAGGRYREAVYASGISGAGTG